jgi:hypothetical protein
MEKWIMLEMLFILHCLNSVLTGTVVVADDADIDVDTTAVLMFL